MDNRRLDEKIDGISEKISEINVTLAAQHISLKEHIRRTEILETRLEPIESHVLLMNSSAKIISLVGIVMGVIAGLAEILHYGFK
jgi:hypothetical protein